MASGDVARADEIDLGDYDAVVVDGFNVMGSRPDGWWRDRPAAMTRLVGTLVRLADEHPGTDWEVCFDGKPHEGVLAAAEGTGVAAGFAGPGRDAADRVIAARVREIVEAEPGTAVLVVSSDRRLAAAVKAAGGATVGSGGFLGRFAPKEGGPPRR